MTRPKSIVRPQLRELPRKLTSRQSKIIDEQLEQQELAVQRMGGTPEDRLRWVVRFARLDLGLFRPEEKVALGYDLRQFYQIGWFIKRTFGPMRERQLYHLQKQIIDGLRNLVTDPRSYLDGAKLLCDPQAGWYLPAARAQILRLSPLGSKPAKFYMMRESDNEEAVILWGVAELLITAGSRLRSCGGCQSPFVARKRQEYCSPECSQRMRNLRRQKKKMPKRKNR